MNIRLINIKHDMQHLEKIRALYNSAFPENERAPFEKLLRKAGKKNINFFSCFCGDSWAGLLYVVNCFDMSYIFYFAVDESMRGKGIGTAVLKAAQKKYAGRRFFLAVEEVDRKYENYSQRLSRLHFYKRAGFKRSGQKMQEGNVIYELMGVGGKVDNKGYRRLIKSFMGPVILFFTMKIIED